MDLDKLEKDWKESPQLSDLAFEDVKDLADHLVKVHRMMMAGELGVCGYLYREQILKMRRQQGKEN